MKTRQDEQLPPFRDPGIPAPADDPYRLLSEFGVTYDSSTAEIHKAGIEAQASNALTPERRRAWSELRSVEKRLLADILFFQPDPSVFAESADSVADAPPGNPGDVEEPSLWALLAESWDPEPHDLPPAAPPESFIRKFDESAGGEK